MEITSALMNNYLPYAKSTIIDRAIPAIDGLKPSNRKILYTMYLMKLLKGNKTKSTNIVGQTMKLHPHGDQTIYDTMVRMATGNETLNVPYIESKGNFGKVYSRDLAYAASRYTEAKLAQICEEIFDGIDEDAVDFVNNYDDTMQEPVLLPVKFPNILTNPSNGIAVGMGSSIPSFGLKNVCNAVIGILDGSITDETSLVNVLGIPEFTTGGNVHIDRAGMIKLAETGRGSITMSANTTLYTDRIVVNELPYKVMSETIVSSVEELAKSGELKEVASVSDEIDLQGFKLVINLKRGCNPQAVLKKLMRLTPLRCQCSFSTKVIVDNECKAFGFLELLHTWIDFRLGCIDRIYKYRYNKAKDKEYFLSAWEKIKLDIRAVANLVANKNEAEAKATLMSQWKLEEKQADYILDMKIREFTQDRLNKHLKELDDIRKDMADCLKVVNSDSEKYKIIIDDQKRIIAKYGKDNKTHIAPVLTDEDVEPEKEEVDDSVVSVVITKNGYLKRLISLRDISGYEVPEGDVEIRRVNAKNTDKLLVFTYDGSVYKINVGDIDAGRGKLKDKASDMVGINDKQIMFIDACGDYSKSFNVVYSNGRGCRVCYSSASGSRSKYRSLFDGAEPGNLWWTFEDKFFMITARRKAAYCDLSLLRNSSRSAFKVARVSTGDKIFGLQDAKNVPDIGSIDLNKYSKEYTVLIGEDELWEGANKAYMEKIGATVNDNTGDNA